MCTFRTKWRQLWKYSPAFQTPFLHTFEPRSNMSMS